MHPIKNMAVSETDVFNNNGDTIKVFIISGTYMNMPYIFRFGYEKESDAQLAATNLRNNIYEDQSVELVINLNWIKSPIQPRISARKPQGRTSHYHLFILN